MLFMNETWRLTSIFFALCCFNWKRSALLAWHCSDLRNALVWSRFHLPTNPVRKLVLRLGLCFENLKLIYPIAVYRPVRVNQFSKKTNHSSNGNSCSRLVFSCTWWLCIRAFSFQFSLVYPGSQVVKRKDNRLKPYKACSLRGTHAEYLE